ncbi:MAG: DNA gyrase subunit A, partial [Patescibacteria group bacterium]
MENKKKQEKPNKRVEIRDISQEMKDSYLSYAMSVIVSRAIPDARDGLKPVHRRVLYAMHEMGLTSSSRYRKSANVVGITMAYYHPHGDMAIYDSMARLAQDFSMRYPSVDGQGNWGCFTKDTKVSLTDGRSLSFGELIKEYKKGKRNYTYAFNHDEKKIEIAEIKKPRLTRKDQKLVKVILDNGEEVRCTLDHLFMLRNGKYKEAKNLKPGDSLMPLYSKTYNGKDDKNLKGYKMIHQPIKNKWEFIHRLADEWNIENNVYDRSVGKIRHHIDFNKLNNNPDNVRRIKWEDHWKLHKEITSLRHKNDPEYVKNIAKGRDKYWSNQENRKKASILWSELNKKSWQDPEFREKMSKTIKKAWENPEYRKKIIKSSSKNLKKLWKKKEFKELMSKLKSKELKERWKDEDYRKAQTQRMKKMSLELWSNPKHREHISNLMKIKTQDPKWKERQSKIAKELWKDKNYRNKYPKDHFSLMAKKLWEDPKTREFHREKAIKQWQNPEFRKKMIELNELRRNEKAKVYNHKVKSIKFLRKKEDVYDLTIDSYHNFALAVGIFVHNSVDGDSPAASRYTEAKLSKFGEMMLNDIEKDTVDFVENYDGTRKEPAVLPSPVPNLLLNGTWGIAVGMATNIPPHNLNEVVDATCYLSDNPKATIEDLFQFIKGPDFPTGGEIYNKKEIMQAYVFGKGPMMTRAKAEIVEEKGKMKIIMSELTYLTNKSVLLEKIANLVKDK